MRSLRSCCKLGALVRSELKALSTEFGAEAIAMAAEAKGAQTVEGGGPAASTRPTWQQSEADIVSGENNQQLSFKNGQEVRSKSKGSVRPEGYKPGESIEVKNYTLSTESGIKSMIRNVVGQFRQRQANLPANTVQNIVLDVRGQNLTAKQMIDIRSRLMTQTGSKNVNISFRTD